MEIKKDRTGETNYNTHGTLMKIIEFKRCDNLTVEFQDKYKAKVNTTYYSFKKGKVKNPYDKSVYNVGCIGEGKYVSRVNGKATKIYETWQRMLFRCYEPYRLNKYPTYIDVYVCDEWLNFQNFAKWYEENYYECNGEEMHLDKDILFKDNKIYSPNTCIFVPLRINILFVKKQNCRGEYPIGVYYDKKNKNLRVHSNILINNKAKRISLGSFPIDKPFQAFTAYKNFKENYIKQVADEYKDLIPTKLYNALYNYKVEIND